MEASYATAAGPRAPLAAGPHGVTQDAGGAARAGRGRGPRHRGSSLAGNQFDWASRQTAALASGGVLLLVAAVFVEARKIPSGMTGSGVAAARHAGPVRAGALVHGVGVAARRAGRGHG
ncbi:hypothetical protein ABZ920_29790 [Streptomyces sp. NPDC046831]|uniref:hypothetical protein n=1 Tax=Streptomyces sp. NPDC046831 TaxID=3154805 RepID=UPI00340F763D